MRSSEKLHAAELTEPIKLNLCNERDEQVATKNQHPAPAVEPGEKPLNAWAVRNIANCVGPRSADPEEWNHHAPNHHAPGAERAKREDALVSEPEDETETEQQATLVQPPEPRCELSASEQRDANRNRCNECSDADDGVTEAQYRSLPTAHVGATGHQNTDCAVWHVARILQGFYIFGEQLERSEPADRSRNDVENRETKIASARDWGS